MQGLSKFDMLMHEFRELDRPPARTGTEWMTYVTNLRSAEKATPTGHNVTRGKWQDVREIKDEDMDWDSKRGTYTQINTERANEARPEPTANPFAAFGGTFPTRGGRAAGAPMPTVLEMMALFEHGLAQFNCEMTDESVTTNYSGPMAVMTGLWVLPPRLVSIEDYEPFFRTNLSYLCTEFIADGPKRVEIQGLQKGECSASYGKPNGEVYAEFVISRNRQNRWQR